MKDRIPRYPGRVKLTPLGNNLYTMERADQPTEAGTELNKATLFDSDCENRYQASTPNEALKYLVREWEVVVTADGWVEGDGYSTNRVNVAEMKAAYNPIWCSNPQTLADFDAESEAFATITQMETFEGYVIFKAIDPPERDTHIRIRGV